MDYQIVLSPSARNDLRDIVRYISFDAPERAIRFSRFLLDETKRLSQFPELGRIVPELGNENFREIIVRSYRIIYRIDHTRHAVEISRFWHAARGTPETRI